MTDTETIQLDIQNSTEPQASDSPRTTYFSRSDYQSMKGEISGLNDDVCELGNSEEGGMNDSSSDSESE